MRASFAALDEKLLLVGRLCTRRASVRPRGAARADRALGNVRFIVAGSGTDEARAARRRTSSASTSTAPSWAGSATTCCTRSTDRRPDGGALDLRAVRLVALEAMASGAPAWWRTPEACARGCRTRAWACASARDPELARADGRAAAHRRGAARPAGGRSLGARAHFDWADVARQAGRSTRRREPRRQPAQRIVPKDSRARSRCARSRTDEGRGDRGEEGQREAERGGLREPALTRGEPRERPPADRVAHHRANALNAASPRVARRLRPRRLVVVTRPSESVGEGSSATGPRKARLRVISVPSMLAQARQAWWMTQKRPPRANAGRNAPRLGRRSSRARAPSSSPAGHRAPRCSAPAA